MTAMQKGPGPLGALRRLLPAILVWCSLAAGAAFAQQAPAAGAYLLSPYDQLMIRVGRWNAIDAVYENWVGLEGEYAVGPDGSLAMPVAGELQAAGRPTQALSAEIASALQQQLGMLQRPFVSVEVVSFRPVFVIGDVERSGEVPFRPGMTVIQATSVAGGLRRPQDRYLRTEREAVNALGDRRVRVNQLDNLLMQAARLQAELAGKRDFELPQEYAAEERYLPIFEAERMIFEARAEELKSRGASIADLRTLLEQQVIKLGEEIELRSVQVELARAEAEDVSSLRERGLAVAGRETAVRQNLADLEARIIELQTARLRAQQQLNEAERDAIDLLNENRLRVVEELQLVQGEIAVLREQIATATSLYREAISFGLSVTGGDEQVVQPVFRVRRGGEDGAFTVIEAGPDLVLEPGDTVEVLIPDVAETD